MIKIIVNNENISVADNLTLDEFLKKDNFDQLHIAIAVNQKVIAHSDYPNIKIEEGDCIDIMTPMQGG